MKKLIYGVAENDLEDHITQKVEYYCGEGSKLKNKKRVVWYCVIYNKWYGMLTRCYKKSELERHPTYENKYVCDDWLKFSKFKAWMETQDYDGKDLDKDLLFEGNTIYSPETCVFIPQELNKFLLEKTAQRELPFGVSYHKKKGKYIAQTGGVQMGTFDDPYSAHEAWALGKYKKAIEFASNQTDERIAKALIKRYADKLSKAIVLKGERSE